MEWAHVYFLAQCCEAERFFEVGFNQLANTLHKRGVARNFAGMATTAGAEAVLFGSVASGKEDDLMPRGPASGAGGTAVNSCGTYGENKLSVGIYVALLDGLPALVIVFDCFHLPIRYAGI
jgi:hypothetical protein